jgi:hypothetical protein
MASYLLATNYRDALPLSDSDRRYFVIFSRWQTKDQITEFMAGNPTYYDDLHDALAESSGAIRKWLLEWEVSPSFKPYGRAPDSTAKAMMVDFAKSDEQRVLEEILAESPRLDMTRQLLNVTELGDEFDKHDCVLPYGKALAKLLIDNGYSRLGHVVIDGRKLLFWSQTPDRWTRAGGMQRRVRVWLEDDL